MMRSLCQLSTLIFFVCLFSVSAPAADAPRLGPLLEKAMQSPGKSFRLESGNTAAVDEEARQAINRNLVKLPLRFEQNEGQTDEQVKFLSRGQGYQFFLTSTESVMVLTKTEREYPRERFGIRRVKFEEPETVEHAVVRMQVVGGNPEPVIRGEDRLSGTSNYFVGNDKSRWRQGVENFASVHYEGVYPGIDLVYYGNQRKLEYDFIVKPGADPKKIELNFSGADGISIDGQGNLVLKTQVGDVVQHAPVIYQTIDGQKQHIDGRYVLTAPNRITFHVAEYDRKHTLIIDPLLQFSTFFNATIKAIAIDNSGNIYLTGIADDVGFPTTSGAFDESFNGRGNDTFISKINSEGSVLVYSTYIGGQFSDNGLGIEVDDSGCVYLTGNTASPDFPTTPGAFQETYSGGWYDAFTLKLNNSGSDLIYSTFLGGSHWDIGFGVAVDSNGNAYIAGMTESTNFPTTSGAFDQNFHFEQDVFVSKLNASGSGLVYSTYIGGRSDEAAYGIAIDSKKNAYVTGFTKSYDFPTTPGAFDSTINFDRDVFVSKLNSAGSQLFYSTFLGGSDYEEALAIALDKEANVYVSGRTLSYDFPTTSGAFDLTYEGRFPDIFVSKINTTENGAASMVYSTFIGGDGYEMSWAIAVDYLGRAHITGNTDSADFPITPGAFDFTWTPYHGDIFITSINEAGSDLTYSSYIGGDGFEEGRSVAIDKAGNFFVAGTTASSSFPVTLGAYDTTFNGGDGYLIKFNRNPNAYSNDFNGNSFSDLLMVDGDGNIVGGILENSVPQSFGFLLTANPAAGWTVNATGDTNGDNKADLLLYNTTTGEYRIATLDGASVLNDSVVFSIDPVIGLEPRGTGDFDGNGEDEILIYQPSTGIVALAYLAGGAFSSFEIVTTLDTANDWALVDAADFTGDAKTDLLIQNTVTGETAVIEMDGSTAVNTTPVFTLDPVMGLSIVTTADFNGDGKTDILAMHTSGALAVLEMDGTTFQSLYVPGGLLPNWQLVNAGNYDGINKADFLFHDPTTGELITGIQDGATITTYNTVLNFGPASGWTFPH